MTTRPRLTSVTSGAARVLGATALLCSAVSSPAAAQPGNTRAYIDEEYRFKVAAPTDWQRANPAGITVPGELCRAWSLGQAATVVIFMQKPNQAVSPRYVLDESARAMKASLGCEIREQAVRDVGGVRAMWLVATGKGV